MNIILKQLTVLVWGLIPAMLVFWIPDNGLFIVWFMVLCAYACGNAYIMMSLLDELEKK